MWLKWACCVKVSIDYKPVAALLLKHEMHLQCRACDESSLYSSYSFPLLCKGVACVLSRLSFVDTVQGKGMGPGAELE